MRVQEAANRTQHLGNKLFRVRRSRQDIQTLRQRLHLSARNLLGSTQRLFRQLTLNGNASEMSNVFDHILLTLTRAARLAIVHGKRSYYFAFGGENRRGPTGAERMRQSQLPKTSPQWIGRYIGYNYLFGPVSGGSA